MCRGYIHRSFAVRTLSFGGQPYRDARFVEDVMTAASEAEELVIRGEGSLTNAALLVSQTLLEDDGLDEHSSKLANAGGPYDALDQEHQQAHEVPNKVNPHHEVGCKLGTQAHDRVYHSQGSRLAVSNRVYDE